MTSLESTGYASAKKLTLGPNQLSHLRARESGDAGALDWAVAVNDSPPESGMSHSTVG